MSTNKFNLLLENARLLSDKLDIVPLLYGSLGLEYLTGDALDADDIDILVPRVFITERWHEFKSFLEVQGYVLADEYEHTFVRDGVAYSYADIEDLESFAGVRIKDITLKRVLNNPGNVETARSIGNQMQMRQIYAKLADIQEFQTYQLERDRDRDIIVPFLDARSLVLEAETKGTAEERLRLLREADGKIRSALNSVYADIETTSKSFAHRTSIPLLPPGKASNRYMAYLTSDMQIATKFVGVRMQLLEYMGETKTAQSVLQQYQHVMYDFLTKPITRKGLSTADLMHNYFPYEKVNMNCWHAFAKEMRPALESGMRTLELSMSGNYSNDVYIVALEDVSDEEE